MVLPGLPFALFRQRYKLRFSRNPVKAIVFPVIVGLINDLPAGRDQVPVKMTLSEGLATEDDEMRVARRGDINRSAAAQQGHLPLRDLLSANLE